MEPLDYGFSRMYERYTLTQSAVAAVLDECNRILCSWGSGYDAFRSHSSSWTVYITDYGYVSLESIKQILGLFDS